MFALKGLIPDKHLQGFQTFVLQKVDLLFLKFCKQFETLCGKEAVSPNMHLYCYLKDIILDHDPVHSFWCFSFERYNDIMGSVFTNKTSLELQLMRKLMFSCFLNCVCAAASYLQG